MRWRLGSAHAAAVTGRGAWLFGEDVIGIFTNLSTASRFWSGA